jgi:hypothetical protein
MPPRIRRAGLVAGLLFPLALPAEAAPGAPVPSAALGQAQEGRPLIGVLLSDDEAAPTVLRALAGSPAAAAGLRAGDVITAVSGVPTPTRAALSACLAALSVGEEVELRLRRGDAALAARLSLADAGDFEEVAAQAPPVEEILELSEVPRARWRGLLADSEPAEEVERIDFEEFVVEDREEGEIVHGEPIVHGFELHGGPHPDAPHAVHGGSGQVYWIEFDGEAEGHGAHAADHGALLDELAGELAEELGEELGETFARLLAGELGGRGRGRDVDGIVRRVMDGLGEEVEAILREELEEELEELGLLPHAAHPEPGAHAHGGAHHGSGPHGIDARDVSVEGHPWPVEVILERVALPEGAHDGGGASAPDHMCECECECEWAQRRRAELGEPHAALERAFDGAGAASEELQALLLELESGGEVDAGVELQRRLRIATVGPDGRVEVRDLSAGGEGAGSRGWTWRSGGGPEGPGPREIEVEVERLGAAGPDAARGLRLHRGGPDGGAIEREVRVRIEGERRSGEPGRARGLAPRGLRGGPGMPPRPGGPEAALEGLRRELDALRGEVDALRRRLEGAGGGRARRR